MDAELLQALRGLSMYKEIWDHEDRIDLDDPATRFEYLRVCRDTERFDKALPLIEPTPSAEARALSEQLAVLDRIGDCRRLGTALEAALRLLDQTPAGTLPDPFLTCAAARAQASFGRLREGLRVMRPYAEHMRSKAPVFSTYMFLFIRLGWYRATHKLIQRVDDLHRDPEDAAVALRQLRRLVSAARALGRIGDVEGALRHHQRAHAVAEPLFESCGMNYPWVWRWHAYLLRTNALWGRMGELSQRAAETTLWTSERNPLPHARIADSSPFRIEQSMAVLARFDGSDHRALVEALDDLDLAAASLGGSADLVQAKSEILQQLDDEQALLAHGREHRHSLPPRIEYVRLLAKRGMPDEASEAVEALLRERPRNPEALQLRVALDADRLAPDPASPSHVASAHGLLKEFPEDAPALAVTAERLAQNGHFNDSEALFGHLTRDNPVFGLGWAGRLRAATWNHDWELVARVEQEFEHREISADDLAIEGFEALYGYWFDIARTLARASQMDFDAADECIAGATDYWRHGIDTEFKSHSCDPLWAWTVERHRWRRRIDAAADRCRRFVEQAPDNPYFLLKYGWVLLDRYDFQGAEARFRRALAIRPESDGAWKGLIRSLRLQLRYTEAHQCAERAKRVVRLDPGIWCEHAEQCLAEHDVERALAVVEEALRLAPNHAESLALRVRCLSTKRDHQSAIAEAELARARRPDSIEVLEAHCKALLRRGWDKEALKVMKEARVRFAKPSATGRGDLAVELLSASVFAQCGADLDHCKEVIASLERHGESATAIATASSLWRLHLRLDKAHELVTGFDGWEREPELLTEYAEIMAARGPVRPENDPERPLPGDGDNGDGYSLADYHLARARHFDPYSISALQRQVHLWNARQRFDDSLAILRNAGLRFGGHFMVELLTAETLVSRGHSDEAVRHCRRSLDRFETRRRQPIRMRITHVRAVRATGDLDRALALARELVADCAASRRARLTLARSLEDFNKTSEALDYLEPLLLELPLYPPVGENAALFCRLRSEFERGHELIQKSMRHYDYTDNRKDVYQRADSGLLAELILTLPSVGGADDAEQLIEVLLGRDDVYSKSLGYISCGWNAVHRDEADQAIEAFRQARDTRMCINEARYGLAQAYMLKADRIPDTGMRRDLLHRARALAQQNIDAADGERSLILAGRACYQLGNWRDSEACFRESIAKHRVHGAHLELAVVLNHMGRLREALLAAENGGQWSPADPRLLAVLGLTRLRLVVEEQDDRSMLERGAGEIDQALDVAPTDPTVLSAVVYAANHTDVYPPTAAYSYLVKALKDEANQASASTMQHLRLMLAELTLRYRRLHGLRLRWRHGPRYWAKRALDYTDDPRAESITKSFWPRRRMARIEERRNGESAAKAPAWLKYTVTAVGLAAVLLGGASLVLPFGGSASATAVVGGAVLATVGLFADRLHLLSFKDFALDLSPATEMAGTLNLPVGPPMRAVVMPQTPANRSDSQWRISESHRRLLGPAVGPMITGHYTYRDANFPWKTR